MKRWLLIMIILASAGTLFSQIQLERQVISCFALNNSGEINWLSTGGQVEYTTIEAEPGFLTQGFEQADNVNFLLPQFLVSHDACNDTYDVVISSLNGCVDTTGTIITWNGIPGGSSQTDLPNPSYISVTTASGCAYEVFMDFTTLPVEEMECDLVFYTYISPNGDGDNDSWAVKNIDNEYYGNNKVIFFNRWGIKIWEGKNYDNNTVVWNGKTTSGEDLPDGTYYYTIEANGTSYKGYVELIR